MGLLPFRAERPGRFICDQPPTVAAAAAAFLPRQSDGDKEKGNIVLDVDFMPQVESLFIWELVKRLTPGDRVTFKWKFDRRLLRQKGVVFE